MDGENCVLEDIRTTAQASISKQVDAHVRPDGDQPAERVESPDQKVVLFEEGLGGAGGTRWGRFCGGHSLNFSTATTSADGGRRTTKYCPCDRFHTKGYCRG